MRSIKFPEAELQGTLGKASARSSGNHDFKLDNLRTTPSCDRPFHELSIERTIFMIASLRGTVTHLRRNSAQAILILEADRVGYEILVASRSIDRLPPAGEEVQIHTHLQVRDDRLLLYGFLSPSERELFRQLVKVSGIGPSAAIALLDTLPLPDLVQAIVSSNVRMLSQAPGVGKKTAERIALELKATLANWRQEAGFENAPMSEMTLGTTPALREDVEITLLALGYEPSEVVASLAAVGKEPEIAVSEDADAWIKAAIAWLSQQD